MARSYEILVDTPFGRRSGVLVLRSMGPRIEGTLCVLQYSGEVFGEQLADGTCRLFGSIAANSRSYSYKALGRITDDKLRLTLYGGDGAYSLTGSRAGSVRTA